MHKCTNNKCSRHFFIPYLLYLFLRKLKKLTKFQFCPNKLLWLSRESQQLPGFSPVQIMFPSQSQILNLIKLTKQLLAAILFAVSVKHTHTVARRPQKFGLFYHRKREINNIMRMSLHFLILKLRFHSHSNPWRWELSLAYGYGIRVRAHLSEILSFFFVFFNSKERRKFSGRGGCSQ